MPQAKRYSREINKKIDLQFGIVCEIHYRLKNFGHPRCILGT